MKSTKSLKSTCSNSILQEKVVRLQREYRYFVAKKIWDIFSKITFNILSNEFNIKLWYSSQDYLNQQNFQSSGSFSAQNDVLKNFNLTTKLSGGIEWKLLCIIYLLNHIDKIRIGQDVFVQIRIVNRSRARNWGTGWTERTRRTGKKAISWRILSRRNLNSDVIFSILLTEMAFEKQSQIPVLLTISIPSSEPESECAE